MSTPLVSIVIPVRNGMPFIEHALESALSTGEPSVEVIVRENGSTDGTREWLEQRAGDGFRLLIADPPCSAAVNWTEVAASATGEFVKLLCADDYLVAGGLRRQLDAAIAHPEAALIASRRRIVSDSGSTVIRTRGLTRMIGLMSGASAATAAAFTGVNPFGEPSSVLFRGDVLRKMLPFSDDFPYVTDLQMYVRVLQHGDFVGLKSVDAVFRLNNSSWSREIGRRQLGELRAWAWDAVARGEVSPSALQRAFAEPRFVATFLARRAMSSASRLLAR